MSSASPAISFGMVAENSSVWRAFGSFATIRRIGTMKPRSSMWSASSSTRTSVDAEVQLAGAHVVEQPAGRGDQHVEAAREQVDLRARPRRRRPRRRRSGPGAGTARRRESCRRSAPRARGSARAPATRAVNGAGRRRSAIRRARIGSAKAAVLPVPVCAMPRRSRPSRRCGMAWAWMGSESCSLRGREREGASRGGRDRRN